MGRAVTLLGKFLNASKRKIAPLHWSILAPDIKKQTEQNKKEKSLKKTLSLYLG